MKPLILVAEDNPDLLGLLRQMFARSSFDAEFVNTGILAGQRYRAAIRDGRPYDLLVFDHAMPMGLGLSVIEEIRKEGDWETPVMLMTAMRPNDVKAKADELGVKRIVYKPFGTDLLGAVSEVLGCGDGLSSTAGS